MAQHSEEDTFLEQDVERFQSFEFFASEWISATSLMDAEQRGWYIQLLAWAWSNTKIQGLLPKDEIELLEIAGNRDLATMTRNSHKQNFAGFSLEDEVRYHDLQQKWKKVREKFVALSEYPDYVHNPKLSQVLRRMKMYRNIRKTAGKTGAEVKWENYRERQDAANNSSSTATKNPHVEIPSKSYEARNSQTRLLPIPPSPSLSPTLTQPKPLSNSSSVGKKCSSLFEESRFVLTKSILEWLKSKYPQLDEEDYEFLREQFCNSRYGLTALSWRLQFYTYVNNKMKKEGYTPFSQMPQKSELGANRNGNKYESTLAERERLAREEDEWLRLRKSGGGDSSESSKALQLPTNELNRKR